MINLNFKNQKITIPSDVYDFDIDLFEKIFVVIQNKQIKLFDKWKQIFSLVGIPDELIANLSIDEFNLIVSEFKFQLNLTKIKQSISIDNVEYKCYDKTFDISVKDYILISNYLDIDRLNNITKVLAILYKSKFEIKNKTNFTDSYITEKAKLFKSVKANYAIPVFNLLNNMLIVQSKMITNE